MTQAELLRYLVDTLDRLALDYMIVGSHASIYYGEPRFTQDVDVVVALTPPALPSLLARFPAAEFYVSEQAAREALVQRGQFNIIHGASGVTIDVFISKDTEYDPRTSSSTSSCTSGRADPIGTSVTSPACSPCLVPISTSGTSPSGRAASVSPNCGMPCAGGPRARPPCSRRR